MYIVHVTTEFTPIAKVGGLADVIAGLSKALKKQGATVEVILPFYSHICREKLKYLEVAMEEIAPHDQLLPWKNTIWSAQYEEISLLLIALDRRSTYFTRGVIYGEQDDIPRFTYFTHTALEYLYQRKKTPDILHLHDWLTTLAAPLYRKIYQPKGWKIGKIVTTIHNMHYQGICSPQKLMWNNCHTNYLMRCTALRDLANPQKINLLKGGLVYSDFLTTVSPTYSRQIQGQEGFGLESLLQQKNNILQGILNGIDTEEWNPATDRFLQPPYIADGEDLDGVRKGKRQNRSFLYSKWKMAGDDSTPLVACISRIVHQKGPELIRFGIDYVLKKGGNFILLGSTLESRLKKEFQILAKQYQDNPHIHCHFLFDEALAHLTYASADCILIPSLFEPCGLTQMIALRYGTIPIVHKVGGLNDTIFDVDHDKSATHQKNGYAFVSPSKKSLAIAIDRAFDDYKNKHHKWRVMQKNGLTTDWSWTVPAQKYLQLYRSIMK